MTAPTPADLTRPLAGPGLLPECGLEWDCAHAHAAARAAAVVYDKVDPAGAFHRAGWPIAKAIERGPSVAAVAVSCQLVLIAIRGSDDRADWFDNLSAWRTSPPYPEAVPRERMHAGFARQLGRLLDPVAEAVREVSRGSATSLLVVGHSLGGALAAPLTVALRKLDVWTSPAVVYTFNSPRVWSEQSRAALERFVLRREPTARDPVAIWRVATVNRGELDPITRVPRRACGYRHVGRTVVLDGGGRWIGEDALAKWRAVRDANPVGNLAGWRIVSRLRRGAGAHAIARALDATEAQALT